MYILAQFSVFLGGFDAASITLSLAVLFMVARISLGFVLGLGCYGVECSFSCILDHLGIGFHNLLISGYNFINTFIQNRHHVFEG